MPPDKKLKHFQRNLSGSCLYSLKNVSILKDSLMDVSGRQPGSLSSSPEKNTTKTTSPAWPELAFCNSYSRYRKDTEPLHHSFT